MKNALIAALILLAAPALADRMAAEADCAPTSEALHYDCTFTLMQGDTPVTGAEFTVKPSMPSMPMAHNMHPMKAEAIGSKGIYRAMLHLEMHGTWALELDISAPARDRIVVHHDFPAP